MVLNSNSIQTVGSFKVIPHAVFSPLLDKSLVMLCLIVMSSALLVTGVRGLSAQPNMDGAGKFKIVQFSKTQLVLMHALIPNNDNDAITHQLLILVSSVTGVLGVIALLLVHLQLDQHLPKLVKDGSFLVLILPLLKVELPTQPHMIA